MAWPYKENLMEGRKVDNDSAVNERILLSLCHIHSENTG